MGDNAIVARISAGRTAPRTPKRIKGEAPTVPGRKTSPAPQNAPTTYKAAGANVKASRLK